MTGNLEQDKAAMREQALRRRHTAAAEAPAAGDALAERVLTGFDYPAAAVVAAYWPMRGEIDPRPLMSALHSRRHRIGLPVIRVRAEPLEFRAWEPGTALEVSTFRTQIPGDDADPLVPDVVFTPLLAFDRMGYRLGYGGGFYDRTLAALRSNRQTLAIGLAFAAQEVAAVPRGPGDERLDWLVTEREVIRCRGEADTGRE